MSTHSFSIVTVMVAEHLPYLKYSTKRLESSGLSKWYIVNNQPEFNVSSLSSNFVEVIEGTTNPYSRVSFGAGIHHSEGLKIAISKVTTPWVIIMDPDFFLIDPNSINQIIDIAENEKKVLIGTPWFPIWVGKRINCVALHFAVAKTCVFDGEFEWYPHKVLNKPSLERKMPIRRLPLIKKMSKMKAIRFFYTITIRRFKINKLLDTAAILENYFRIGQSKFLEIGITSKQVRQIFDYLPAKFWISFERRIPRRISYFPNSTKLISNKVPRGLEFMEHFLLNDKILGFHLRSYGNKINKSENECNPIEVYNYIETLDVTK